MREKLVAVLTYHVVPGRISAKEHDGRAKQNAARSGSRPSRARSSRVESKGNTLTIWDGKGNASKVTIQNGVPVERRHPRGRHRAAAERLIPLPRPIVAAVPRSLPDRPARRGNAAGTFVGARSTGRPPVNCPSISVRTSCIGWPIIEERAVTTPV